MPIAEHAVVRLRCDLTADDGRVLPTGTEATVVHIGRDQHGEFTGYIIEAFIKDEALRHGGSWHLAAAASSAIEPLDCAT